MRREPAPFRIGISECIEKEPGMNDLYLTGVSNNDVRLKNTFHLQGGGWSPFIDVNGQELNEPGPLYAVACAADVDDLHVIAVTNVNFDPTNGGQLWYTTRLSNW